MTDEQLRGLGRKVSLDDLLVVALLNLESEGAVLNFENLVARCYELFPERFSLRGYPQWPDSGVVNKSWLRARSDKHWIVGSVRQGFRLTPQGRRHAEGLIEEGNKLPERGVRADRRTREGRLLEAMKQTRAYGRFVGSGDLGESPELAEIADALLATGDASVATLTRNAAQMRAAAGVYDDTDALRFLDAIDGFMQRAHRRERSAYAGGMMQQRKKK